MRLQSGNLSGEGWDFRFLGETLAQFADAEVDI
jgi:hypothetical protein